MLAGNGEHINFSSEIFSQNCRNMKSEKEEREFAPTLPFSFLAQDLHLQQQQQLQQQLQQQQQQLLAHLHLLHNRLPPSPPESLPPNTHSLHVNGLCKWTGCDTPCDTDAAFNLHLKSVHGISEKSTAQTKVQMQIVEQLENQLGKEQARLEAMLAHLQAVQQPKLHHQHRLDTDEEGVSVSQLGLSVGGTKRESTDGEGSVDQNRDFYKAQDVRPPYTYAALIRQAILESVCGQLTLNEIYAWFSENFGFYRHNTSSWKNAVRHNLSLHKCFMRVENVKGAVWTVDETEFHRRRPQRSTSSITKSPSLPYSHENKSPAAGGLGYQRGGGSPSGDAATPFAQEDSFNRSLQSALDKLGSVQYGGDIGVQYSGGGGASRAGEVGALRVRTEFDNNRDETASPPRMSEREKTLLAPVFNIEARLPSPQETKPNLDIRIFNQSGERSQMSSGDEMNLLGQSEERSQSRGVELDQSGDADSQSKDIPEDLSMGSKEEGRSERSSIEN